MDKSVVFIDGGYIADLLKNVFGNHRNPAKINYKKLVDLLASESESEALKTYYYYCEPYISFNPTPEEIKKSENFGRFVNYLSNVLGFEVKLGCVKKHEDYNGKASFVQKGVDVMFAINAIETCHHGIDGVDIQKEIFLAGDGDFVPVVKTVHKDGVEVCLAYSASCVSQDLLDVCDDYIHINRQLIDKCRFDSK